MPNVAKGKNMHTDPWKVLRIGAPLSARSMTLLVSVATASAFAYAAFATIDHQTALATAWITAGESHACELARSGGVKCRRDNGDGELGDNTTSTRLIPVDASAPAAPVTAGTFHTCALPVNGRIKFGVNGSCSGPSRS
jgi:hypothetical protein